MKPEYDLKSLKRADPSRVREIMANSEPTVKVIRADGSSCRASLEPSFGRLEGGQVRDAEVYPAWNAPRCVKRK
jgi:hypothetical protein